SPMQSHPLPTALEKMTEQWNTAKTQARFDIVGNPLEISPQAYTTLYRATQEALTNVGKHANASRVVVTLDYSDESAVRLNVRDNGEGSRSLTEGFGLLGLRERAQLLGGKVRLETNSGEGFMLEVELPV